MRKPFRLALIAAALTAGLGLGLGISEIQAKGDTQDPPSPYGEKRDIAAIKRVFTNPVVVEATEDPSMSVTFFHTDHKGLNCAVCHHRLTATGDRYVSCGTSPDCHVRKGISPRGKSLFQAAHRTTSAHSCYGCHFKERARLDDVKGCTTCHTQLEMAANP